SQRAQPARPLPAFDETAPNTATGLKIGKPNAIKRPAPFCKKHNNWRRPRQDFLPLRVSSPQELTGRGRLSPLGMAARPSSGGRNVYLTNNCGCRRKTDSTMACPCSEAPRVWSQWSKLRGPEANQRNFIHFLKK